MTDQTLVVNEAERNYLPPNQFTKPDAGNEFVRVNVTLSNPTNRNVEYFVPRFKVQDSGGVQREWQSISELPYPIRNSSLAPGGTVSGNMVFQAPQGDPGLKLIYQPNTSRNEIASVSLG